MRSDVRVCFCFRALAWSSNRSGLELDVVLFDWLAGWRVGGLAGWLVGWLDGWLVDWMTD